MYRLRQIRQISLLNFRRWRRSPQVWLAFALGFIACYLLSAKVVEFAVYHDTVLQICEPFIWTFGDDTSIFLISLSLLLLFSDTPSLESDVPFMLVRTTRFRFVLGQIMYIVLSTVLFCLFILFSTTVLCMVNAYSADMWSETAAILGYSEIGEEIAVPAFVKVLEFSFPYECTLHIFALVLGYALLMAGIIFYFNLLRNKCGMVAGVIFSGFGVFLTPDVVSEWLNLPYEQYRIANIMFGWLSPLNHATYYMHNFGYDNLPRLWHSYVFFGVGSLLFFALSVIRIRRYSFNFTGTERG